VVSVELLLLWLALGFKPKTPASAAKEFTADKEIAATVNMVTKLLFVILFTSF